MRARAIVLSARSSHALDAGRSTGSGYGAVVLDDCNFHECINLDDFESTRTLALIPPDGSGSPLLLGPLLYIRTRAVRPLVIRSLVIRACINRRDLRHAGEFTVMNYRITATEFRAPFRVFPFVEEMSPYKVELVLKVCAAGSGSTAEGGTASARGRCELTFRKPTTGRTWSSGVGCVCVSRTFSCASKCCLGRRFPTPKNASSVTAEIGQPVVAALSGESCLVGDACGALEGAWAGGKAGAGGGIGIAALGSATGAGAALGTAGQSAEYNVKERQV